MYCKTLLDPYKDGWYWHYGIYGLILQGCDIGQDPALGPDPDSTEIQYTTPAPVVYVYPGKYAALRLLSNISPPIL